MIAQQLAYGIKMNEERESLIEKYQGAKSLSLHWLYKASHEERYVYQIEVVEKVAHQYYVTGSNWNDAMDRFETNGISFSGGPEDVSDDDSCYSVVQDDHPDYYDSSSPKKVRRIKQYRFDHNWINQEELKDNAIYMACHQPTISRVLMEFMGVGPYTELKLHLESI